MSYSIVKLTRDIISSRKIEKFRHPEMEGKSIEEIDAFMEKVHKYYAYERQEEHKVNLRNAFVFGQGRGMATTISWFIMTTIVIYAIAYKLYFAFLKYIFTGV